MHAMQVSVLTPISLSTISFQLDKGGEKEEDESEELHVCAVSPSFSPSPTIVSPQCGLPELSMGG